MEKILPVGLDNTTLSAVFGLTRVPIMRRTWKSLHHQGDHQSTPYPSITQLLSSSAPNAQTSVPQDRIYAFLGLNVDPNMTIEPNYRDSELEVHVCAAKATVQGSNGLDMFDYLCRSGDGDYDRPFTRRTPTWAPDFTCAEHLTPFSISRTLSRQSEYLLAQVNRPRQRWQLRTSHNISKSSRPWFCLLKRYVEGVRSRQPARQVRLIKTHVPNPGTVREAE